MQFLVFFSNLKFYYLIVSDMLFIGGLFLIGFISNKISDTITSFSTAIFTLLLILLAVILLYSSLKYFFYKHIGRHETITFIAVRHSTRVLTIAILLTAILLPLYKLVPVIINPEKVHLVQSTLSAILWVSLYLFPVNFHMYDQEKLFPSLFSSLKSVFSMKTVRVIIADTIILAVFYLVYLFIIYLFKLLIRNISTFKMLSQNTNYVIIFIVVALLLTINKLIVYNVKASSIR